MGYLCHTYRCGIFQKLKILRTKIVAKMVSKVLNFFIFSAGLNVSVRPMLSDSTVYLYFFQMLTLTGH